MALTSKDVLATLIAFQTAGGIEPLRRYAIIKFMIGVAA